MKSLNRVGLIAVTLFMASGFICRADNAPAPDVNFPILSAAPQAELPEKAAELVAKSDSDHQRQTTISVVKAALGLNPAAAPAIVGAISKEAPQMAPVAAAKAVSLVPDQAQAIALAAAATAPKQAGKIVEAICRVLPKSYREIAEAVAQAAPGSDKQILAGISAAIPSLKSPISQIVLAAGKNSKSSVLDVLNQLPQTSLASTSGASSPHKLGGGTTSGGPVIQPPYVAPPTAVNNLDPGSGGQVPPGGRNYATP